VTPHPERVGDYLQHILDAIRRATSYVGRVQDFEAFERDSLVQDAVIRAVEVIGEAATKIQQAAPDLVAKHSDVPWKQMRTMRNKMIHDYFDVDLQIVWTTVRQDLPKLSAQLSVVLQSLPNV